MPVPLIVAAAVIAAGAAVHQGVQASKAAKTQAKVQRQQAKRSRQEAASAEDDFRRQQSRVLAARRAALGASGVDPSTGSPLLVSEDFAGETELQALRIRSGGELRATRLEQQAGLTRFAGRTARTQSFLRGGSLLLSGSGRAFGAPATPTTFDGPPGGTTASGPGTFA